MIQFQKYIGQSNHQPARVMPLLQVTCVFWFIAKMIGWKVWIAERSFPVIAPFDFLYKIPALTHWIFFLASMTLLIFLALFPRNTIFQRGLFFSELCACLLDENRWQPWQYLYLFILLIFILHKNKTTAVGTCCIVAIATVYCYSGLHKFNSGFLTIVWEHMILKLFLKVPVITFHKAWIHFAGYLLPMGECLGGIGLLFTKTKKIAALLLITMHVFLLAMIGPLGLTYEKILWPWNLAMISLLFLIFIRNNKRITLSFAPLSTTMKLLLLCWGISPAFNFIGLWDNFLSWNLYSSNLPDMTICIKDNIAPPQLVPFFSKNDRLKICKGNQLLHVQAWAMQEMNLPACPEERVYKKIAARWEKNFPGCRADFTIYSFPLKLTPLPVKNSSD